MNAPARPSPADLAINVEQALLGAILVSPSAIDAAMGIVEPTDFLDPVHSRIFTVALERRDSGSPTDLRMMRAVLGEYDLGGMTVSEYLVALEREATTVNGAPGYAREVCRLASLRRLRAVGADLLAATEAAETGNPEDLAAQAIEGLDEVAAASRPANLSRVTIGAAGARALAAATDLTPQPNRLPWGIASLDAMTGHMRGGQLIVVAGRPSMGKSAFAVQIALNVALRRRRAYVVSLEMTAEELAQRALSNLAFDAGKPLISYRDLADSNLSDDALSRLRVAQERLDDLPFEIEQQPGLSVQQIAARARRQQATAARSGVPLGLIVVDHMGIMKPSKRYSGNRVAEITEISGGLKALAKELDVPVMALCQLSRNSEQREDKRPVLSDLRDSGSIEQDADIVIGLYREGYYLERITRPSEEQINRLSNARNTLDAEILKARQSKTGTVRLFCQLAANVITDRAR